MNMKLSWLSLKIPALMLLFMLAISGCTTTSEPEENLSTIERARLAYKKNDYGQTLVLLNALVQQGNSEAQYALGYMYYYGQGLPRNQERALYWITLASKNGCQKAEHALQLLRLQEDRMASDSKSSSNDFSDGSCTPETTTQTAQ
jgi:TPR repeat protein